MVRTENCCYAIKRFSSRYESKGFLMLSNNEAEITLVSSPLTAALLHIEEIIG